MYSNVLAVTIMTNFACPLWFITGFKHHLSVTHTPPPFNQTKPMFHTDDFRQNLETSKHDNTFNTLGVSSELGKFLGLC